MEITDAECLVVDADWRNWFFVRIETDGGIEGVGEALAGEGLTGALEAAFEAQKHYLLGEDPLNRRLLHRRLTRYPFAWRAGKLINAVAAAVDIALWDVAGKHFEEPVWKLLGGKVRDTIPAYANGWHIGERTPDTYARQARRAVEEQGYRALKCDPFAHHEYRLTGAELGEVRELLQAVRETVGPEVDLALDAHGRFAVHGAIEAARGLSDLGLWFLEEPVELEDPNAMAEVREAIEVPVATGERIYNNAAMGELVRRRACDIIQPDVTNYGSLPQVQHAAAMAEARYMTIAPHNPSAGVSTAASVHLCAGLENLEVLEHMSRDVEWRGEVVETDHELVDGRLTVPDTPGLGVRFDADAARDHPGEPKESPSLFDASGALKRP